MRPQQKRTCCGFWQNSLEEARGALRCSSLVRGCTRQRSKPWKGWPMWTVGETTAGKPTGYARESVAGWGGMGLPGGSEFPHGHTRRPEIIPGFDPPISVCMGSFGPAMGVEAFDELNDPQVLEWTRRGTERGQSSGRSPPAPGSALSGMEGMSTAHGPRKRNPQQFRDGCNSLHP